MNSLAKTGEGRPSPVAGGFSGFNLQFEILREWEALPGKVLRFACRMYLSGDLALKRESTIGLGTDERAASLLDFRMRILADILVEPPTMSDKPTPIPRKSPEDRSPIEYAPYNWVEIHGFPPESIKSEGGEIAFTLAERAYVYFSQEDATGNRFFTLLVEDIVNEYWRRAIPRDYFPPAEGLK